MDKHRFIWIDILRGISMLLIVYGHIIIHCDKLGELTKYIVSFHVPIFFMISGFVFSLNEKLSYKEYIWKKFKMVMIPYFIFGFLFLISFALLGNGIGAILNRENEVNVFKNIFGIFYGNGHDGLLRQNSSLWFLPCIFITQQFFYFVEKLSLKYKKRIQIYIGASCITLILGFISYSIPHTRLPWGIDVAIVLSFFFAIGKILNILYENWKNNKNTIVIAIVLLIIGFLVGMYNTDISCMNHEYGNYWLFAISALSTSIGLVFIMQRFNKNKIIEYIGNNTIGILVFHKLVIVLFQTKLGIISTNLLHGNIFIQILLSLLVLIMSVASCFIPIIIIKKYFPILLGERRKAKNGRINYSNHTYL